MPGGRCENATSVDEGGGAEGVALGSVATTRPSAAVIGGWIADAAGNRAASGWRSDADGFGEAASPQATNIAVASKSIPILAFVTRRWIRASVTVGVLTRGYACL